MAGISSRIWLRVGLIVAAMVLIMIGVFTDLRESLLRPDDIGFWTGFYITVVFVVFGAVGIPPALFILSISAVWPFPAALAICYSGGLGAALVGFLVSRYVAGESLATRIPPKLMKYERRMETHGFSTVLLLRLLFYLFPPVNWLLGASRIRLGTFAAGTALGALPGTLVMVWSGDGLVPYLLGLPWPVLATTVAVVAGVLVWWWKRLLPR